jgi:hypothetical protein
MAKISLKIKKDNFTDFIQKLNELSNIDDVLKLKITSDKIFMYSVVSTTDDNTGSILAMKYFNLDTSEYIDGVDDKEYHFILVSTNKFIKNLKIMNLEYDVKMDLNFREIENEVCQVRSCQFINNKLKLSYVGGEDSKIKDISYEAIESRFNPTKAKSRFNVSIEDLISIKKLSSINSEEKIFNINIKDGIVTLYETGKWEIEVDNVNSKNSQLFFTKKYLSNINMETDGVEFLLFETFIVIKDDISSLLCAFEQTFDDDDE